MYSKDFRFENSLSEYIKQLKQTTPITPSDEAELRTHFQDASEDLLKCGLNGEEAFIIAAKRMGRAELVGEEYKKLNTGFVTDKTWAYMLLGYCIVSSLVWMYQWLSNSLLLYMARHLMSEVNLSRFIFAGFYLTASAAIWSVLKWGKFFSRWLQHNIDNRPWLTTFLFFGIPAAFVFMLPGINKSSPGFFYPQFYLKGYYPSLASISASPYVQMSMYVFTASAIIVTLLCILKISHSVKLSTKGIFERPNYFFLILFGFTVELFAAATRIFQFNQMITPLFFVLMYGMASFVISYYNQSRVAVYLGAFVSVGLVVEIGAGISADVSRGGTFYTAYYVAGIIAGALAGWALGGRIGKQQLEYR